MKAYSLSPPSVPPQTRWQRFTDRRLPGILIFLMVVVFVAAVLYPYMVITVSSGYVGVLWKRFGGLGIYCWCIVGRGTVLDPRELREEGLHIIWPWDKLYLYDIRLRTTSQTYNAISKDGVGLAASINVRFQLKHNSVAQLHKFIGPDYLESVIKPEIGSRTREVISKYTAEEVYSTSRQAIEDEIRKAAQEKLGNELDRLVQPEASDQFQSQSAMQVTPDLKHSIDIFDTLVLGIELPNTVITAINNKIEQLYIAQEYQFRIEREQKESERKRIEAAGIHDFQQIVSQGISDSYLRWRGIEATLQLAQSTNAKIVIVGSGKDGLPIILGNVDAAGTPSGVGPTTQPLAGMTPGEKITTARPAAPLQTTPGAGLPVPSGNKSADGSTPPSLPDQPRSYIPLTLAEIEAMLARLAGIARPSSAETGSVPKPSPEARGAGGL